MCIHTYGNIIWYSIYPNKEATVSYSVLVFIYASEIKENAYTSVFVNPMVSARRPSLIYQVNTHYVQGITL